MKPIIDDPEDLIDKGVDEAQEDALGNLKTNKGPTSAPANSKVTMALHQRLHDAKAATAGSTGTNQPYRGQQAKP
jgi:hypothetical protein